jgi:hypothetical protein
VIRLSEHYSIVKRHTKMSTQTSTFPAIPFTHTHPQQSFRLLELPPELLELLSSDSPPTYVIHGIPT